MNSRIFILLFLLSCQTLLAQIKLTTYHSNLPSTAVSEDADSCDCYHMFLLIKQNDAVAINKMINQGFDVNCTQQVYYEHTRSRFLRPNLTKSYYLNLNPVQFAAASNQLEIVKILYQKGDRVNEEFWYYLDQDLQNVDWRRHTFPFLEEFKIDSNIINYLDKNGFLNEQERNQVLSVLSKTANDFRSNPSLYYEFKQIIKEVDSSYIPVDQGILYSALSNNCPFLYEYLVDIQEYDLTKPHEFRSSGSLRRRGFFITRASGSDHVLEMDVAILNSNYPTIDLLEFGLKHGVITKEQIMAGANDKYYFFMRKETRQGKLKLYRKYCRTYKELDNAQISTFKKNLHQKKLQRISERLYKANHWENWLKQHERKFK